MENEITIIEKARYGIEMEILKEAAASVTFEDVTEGHLENDRGKVSADFVPYRLVANLDIPYIQNKSISQPIKLRVYFTYNELIHLHRPKLAYWKSNQWKPFKQIVQYPLAGNLVWAGYLEVEFEEWGDPPVALGN